MTDFEQVYAENYPIVYKFTFSLCRDPSLAEEITQASFVKALEHYSQFDRRCRLYVWICQIARNTYYSHLRRQKHLLPEQDVPPMSVEGPEETVLAQDTAARVSILVEQLPPPYREVFSLRVDSELSFSQIGAVYGKTDSWARLIYYRAKKRIQEGLQ